MPKWSMRRLALITLCLCSAITQATPPKDLLIQRYKSFNTNILRGDRKGMSTWLNSYCAKDFTYTSYQKSHFNRDGYLGGLLQQIQVTEKVLKSVLTVRSIQKAKNTLIATVASDFKGIVAIDTKHLTLTDQSVTLETWKPEGNDWKLVKVVQVNADTQMQQDEER